MGLSLETPPASYPISLTEAKAHLRVTSSSEDATINTLIMAANDYVEQYTGRSVAEQTWVLSIDCFTDTIKLPKGPATAVTSVVYDDAEGAEQTLAGATYTADLSSDPQWIVRNSGESWPTTLNAVNAVRITYTAGYASAPESIRQAMLLLISQWFDHRSGIDMKMEEMPHAVTALLANHRLF